MRKQEGEHETNAGCCSERQGEEAEREVKQERGDSVVVQVLGRLNQWRLCDAGERRRTK